MGAEQPPPAMTTSKTTAWLSPFIASSFGFRIVEWLAELWGNTQAAKSFLPPFDTVGLQPNHFTM
jgi:hypothetical protein